MNEKELIEKLKKIENLFSGAATTGERISAELAKERIMKRLQELLPEEPSVEFKFTFPDTWNRKVFLALLRRYNLTPYRYKRQRYTTVMVKVPTKFVDETLWPEYLELHKQLEEYLEQTTHRIISQVLNSDSSEAEVMEHKELRQDAAG